MFLNFVKNIVWHQKMPLRYQKKGTPKIWQAYKFPNFKLLELQILRCNSSNFQIFSKENEDFFLENQGFKQKKIA